MLNEPIENIEYLQVMGPEALSEMLNELWEKNQTATAKGPLEYYFKYQLGNQVSLIKVDLNAQPPQFWYYDTLGRPPTNVIKEVIAQFLWEKCGEKERFAQTLKEENDNG